MRVSAEWPTTGIGRIRIEVLRTEASATVDRFSERGSEVWPIDRYGPLELHDSATKPQG